MYRYNEQITLMLNQRLSKELGISSQRIYGWRKTGVPAERVIQICEALHYKVTPHDLRPDLYPYLTDAVPADYREWVMFGRFLTEGAREALAMAD